MPRKPTRRTLKSLGDTLREARLASGLNQKQVGSRIKITQSLVAQQEAGRFINPRPSILKALARLYKIDYRSLVAVFVRDKYGVDYFIGEKPQDPLILLLEGVLVQTQTELAKLKGKS